MMEKGKKEQLMNVKLAKKMLLMIMCVAATIVMVSCKSKEIEAQKEKSNLQKDKSAIAEIHYLMGKVDYMNGFDTNPNGVRINDDGRFNILDLLSEDVSEEIVEEIEEYWGGDDFTIHFLSKTFKNAVVRYINVEGGIIEVNSETLDFYINSKGQHDGLYIAEGGNVEDVSTESTETAPTTEVPTTEKKKVVLNPFDGLKIDYMGASPFLKVNIDNSMCGENEQNYISYEFEDKYYKLGDKVVVRAVVNGMANDEECEYVMSLYEKEYKVSDATEWLTVIGDTDMTEINQEVEDAYAAKAVIRNDKWAFGGVFIASLDCEISSVKSVELKNRYFISFKSNRYEEFDKSKIKNFNYYVTIYDVIVEMTDGSTRNMNCSVTMTNIKKDTDGKLRWDVGYEFKCVHNDYEQLLSEVVIQKRDKYNVAELDIE